MNEMGSWCINILAVSINSLFTSPIAFLTWGWVSKFSTTSGLKKRCHHPPLLDAPFHGEFFSGFPALLADDKGQGSRASWKSVKTITATHPPAYFPTFHSYKFQPFFIPFPSLRVAYRRIPAFIPLSDSALARGTKRVRLHSVVKLKGGKFDAKNLVFTNTTIHRNINCSH